MGGPQAIENPTGLVSDIPQNWGISIDGLIKRDSDRVQMRGRKLDLPGHHGITSVELTEPLEEEAVSFDNVNSVMVLGIQHSLDIPTLDLIANSHGDFRGQVRIAIGDLGQCTRTNLTVRKETDLEETHQINPLLQSELLLELHKVLSSEINETDGAETSNTSLMPSADICSSMRHASQEVRRMLRGERASVLSQIQTFLTHKTEILEIADCVDTLRSLATVFDKPIQGGIVPSINIYGQQEISVPAEEVSRFAFTDMTYDHSSDILALMALYRSIYKEKDLHPLDLELALQFELPEGEIIRIRTKEYNRPLPSSPNYYEAMRVPMILIELKKPGVEWQDTKPKRFDVAFSHNGDDVVRRSWRNFCYLQSCGTLPVLNFLNIDSIRDTEIELNKLRTDFYFKVASAIPQKYWAIK